MSQSLFPTPPEWGIAPVLLTVSILLCLSLPRAPSSPISILPLDLCPPSFLNGLTVVQTHGSGCHGNLRRLQRWGPLYRKAPQQVTPPKPRQATSHNPPVDKLSPSCLPSLRYLAYSCHLYKLSSPGFFPYQIPLYSGTAKDALPSSQHSPSAATSEHTQSGSPFSPEF